MVVSGVLKSLWASNQTTPGAGSSSPATIPTEAKQLPERTTGNAPSARAAATRSEIRPISSKQAVSSPEPLRSLCSQSSSTSSRVTVTPPEESASSAPASSSRSGPRPIPLRRLPSS